MAAVGNLIVYTNEPGEYVELPSTSTRYRIVEAAIHLGLSILETSEGRRSLAEVATAIVRARRNRKRPQQDVYQGSLEDMPIWIRRFLASMRENFPAVFLSDEVEGEAEAERLEWANDMREYDAGLAGNLYLSRVLIDNMVYARQNYNVAGDSYSMFKFQMGISIAHEIVHLLTGFVSGTPRPDTPPSITLDPYGTRRRGEAGRLWESVLLGGVVEFWSSNDDPLGVRQAGMPFLFADGRRNTDGYQVSLNYINEIINGAFSFPIRTSAQATPMNRDALTRASSTETTRLRSRRRARPAASSPPADHPSSSISFRRLPFGSQYYSTEPSQSSRSYYRR